MIIAVECPESHIRSVVDSLYNISNRIGSEKMFISDIPLDISSFSDLVNFITKKRHDTHKLTIIPQFITSTFLKPNQIGLSEQETKVYSQLFSEHLLKPDYVILFYNESTSCIENIIDDPSFNSPSFKVQLSEGIPYALQCFHEIIKDLTKQSSQLDFGHFKENYTHNHHVN